MGIAWYEPGFTEMEPVSVLVVDDNLAFLRTVVRFLQAYSQGEVTVVGVANSGEDALVKAQRLRPQVILLDLKMPGLSGLVTIPRLHETIPEARILVLTLLDDQAYRQAALTAGADEFVSKNVLATDLLPAIRRVTQQAAGDRKGAL